MGNTRKLWIEGPVGRLEAALRVAERPRAAAVLAHPHPQHGGTLHNPVIFHADRELNRNGFTTLRLNFRGVGDSEGAYDEGRGEVDDLAAAVSWLRGIVPAVPMLLVGYSFGSMCSARHALSDPDIVGLIAIGLPVKTYPLAELERLGRPLAVVQGTEDELGNAAEVRERIAGLPSPARLFSVAGATHLFPGKAPEAAARVVTAAGFLLGAEPAN